MDPTHQPTNPSHPIPPLSHCKAKIPCLVLQNIACGVSPAFLSLSLSLSLSVRSPSCSLHYFPPPRCKDDSFTFELLSLQPGKKTTTTQYQQQFPLPSLPTPPPLPLPHTLPHTQPTHTHPDFLFKKTKPNQFLPHPIPPPPHPTSTISLLHFLCPLWLTPIPPPTALFIVGSHTPFFSRPPSTHTYPTPPPLPTVVGVL